jgi:chaperonin GroES
LTMLDEIADPDAVEVEPAQVQPEAFVAMVTQSQNLAAELTDAKLTEIARQVLDEYRLDKSSMEEWLERMKRGLDLAKMVKVEKTYPFKNAANVKYPLVASAALQFNARSYPAIVQADQVVRAATFGKDPEGKKAARGERIAAHMSWQLLSQVEEWEEDTDKLLLQLPIVGTMVRKWWFDPVQERPRCRLLEPGKFIVNEKVRNLSDAPRCTEELPLYPAEIRTRILSKQFIPFEYDLETTDKQAPQEFIEQHCRIDLDDDGYAEPYIVTMHVGMEKVVKVVADFEPDDVKYLRETRQVRAMVQVPIALPTGETVMAMQEVMQPQEVVTGIAAINRGSYFEAYKFMPGIDGGFHGTGLGLLLGDISDTINTIINLMLDAGHMASLGGGFIGSEFRLKGGSQRFQPGEWKLPSERGADIKSSIVPLTFPGPDAVLFQMLGLLIDAGKEISSTKDIMTGDNGGKVQTATTTLALIEQGMMVFSAAYKRIFRSLKGEYRMLAKINARTVDAEQYNRFHDETGPDGQPAMYDPAQDYDVSDMDIQPVADPRSVTKMQQMAKAELLTNLATQGMVVPAVAAERVLEAAEIGNIEELVPKLDPAQAQAEQMAMQMQMEMAKSELTLKMVDIDLKIAQIETEKAVTIKTMVEAEAIEARIRLDGMTLLLKDRRDAIEQTLKGNDQAIKAGLGRLAIQSRDRGGAGRGGADAATAGVGMRG